MNTIQPLGDTANHLVDQAAQGTEAAVGTTRRFASEAEQRARRSIEAVRQGSQQLRDKAQRASDGSIAYIKEEPVKAVLIAAVAGAALLALTTLMLGRVQGDRR